VAQSDNEHLERGLSERHIHLIAIGGAIGFGLFLASGRAIASAGPSLLLSYILAGGFIYLIMRALGEVAVEHPVSGSFSAYAHKFISPCAGFMIGWSYWLLWILSCMAQITAVGIYCSFWWPELPQWIPALASLICIVSMNLFSVKMFGEFEFWFSIIKVATIVGIIIAGISVIFFGVGTGWHPVGISNLYALDGGFFPHGISGILEALVMAMFAFIGVEFIGVTAGEARNPDKTIPSTINKVVPTITFFYFGTLFVILCLYPWMNLSKGGGINASPFVSTFVGLGIKQAAAIINFVVITASISACNSGMFSNGRMLYNLALNKQAPGFLTKVNATSKVPVNAIVLSFFVCLIGVLLNYVMPDKVFMALASTITCLALWTWGAIVVVQMFSRRGMSADDISKLKYPMPFYPYSNYIIFAVLIVVAFVITVGDSRNISAIIGPIWLILLYISYKLFLKKSEKGTDKM